MADHQRLKRRRIKLFNENPFCPKCDVKMILPEEIGFIIKPTRNDLKSYPDNLCVIMNKLSKFDPEKKNNIKSEVRTEICCNKCNRKISVENENSFLTIEEKRKRSGSRPLSEIKWNETEYNFVNSALQYRLLNNKIYDETGFGKIAKEISEETLVDFFITKAILLQHNDIKVENGKVIVSK